MAKAMAPESTQSKKPAVYVPPATPVKREQIYNTVYNTGAQASTKTVQKPTTTTSAAPVYTGVYPASSPTPTATAPVVTTPPVATAPAVAPTDPGLGTYIPANTINYTPTRSSLMGAADLAALYGGITYDQNAIRGMFDDATKAEYAMLRKEYDTTANKFYGQMYGAQNVALDTIRKANAAAVATGASRGVQAANELSAILGLEDTTNETATQLAADRNLLMDKEAAAYTKNVVDALNTSNTVKLSLGNLGANIYASDTQYDVGTMQYYAALNQAAQALEAAKVTASSNLEGTKYAADQNLASTKYNADSNLTAAQAAALANVQAAQTAASANVKAAGISSAAQKSYYDSLSKNGTAGATDYESAMRFIQGQYTKALQDNDLNTAAIWYGQLTGMSQKDALKTLQKQNPPKSDKTATDLFWQLQGTVPGTTLPKLPLKP